MMVTKISEQARYNRHVPVVNNHYLYLFWLGTILLDLTGVENRHCVQIMHIWAIIATFLHFLCIYTHRNTDGDTLYEVHAGMVLRMCAYIKCIQNPSLKLQIKLHYIWYRCSQERNLLPKIPYIVHNKRLISQYLKPDRCQKRTPPC